ncbi:GGDEF domain-containing protein [Paenibacillus spiritus]|nr:GGDEF domain-containing protein [Paenibacillus spiritus]
MRTTGRAVALTATLMFHSFYLLYYHLSGRGIDPLDWFGYPLLLALGYWGGLQYDRANFYAHKDPLTLLYNRRYAASRIPAMIRTARRRSRKLYLLLIDCDDFKQINDTLSHAAGDRLLTAVGRILLRAPKRELAARWGGDEFLICGYCDDIRDMEQRIEELRSAASALSASTGMPVSISVGSALFPDDRQDQLEQLLQLADRRMYAQKNGEEAASPPGKVSDKVSGSVRRSG